MLCILIIVITTVLVLGLAWLQGATIHELRASETHDLNA